MSINILDASYKILFDENSENLEFPELFHSDVYYVRAALEERLGRKLTLEEVHAALKAEGLLPAEEYGIPRWYARKWLEKPHTHSGGVGDV